jgi:hypothetical protein
VAYRQDFLSSARRHLASATALFSSTAPGAQPGCQAVAGYLYGITGELALKHMMRQSGMQPGGERRNDPFHAHFPTLKTLLRDTARGRRAGELRRLAEDSSLFQNWDTDMRYAPSSDVDPRWVSQWKQRAEELVETMDLT